MDAESGAPDRNKIPAAIEDDSCNIVNTEWQRPGVWYAANESDDRSAGEFHIVERDSACISSAAKSYGMPLEHHPDLLLCRLDDLEGGGNIVRYEIIRYRRKNGLPLTGGVSLLEAAVYGMENSPGYFGGYPAPILTPRGTLTRCKRLVNGVFALETDCCQRMIAVCYPIADANFSDYTRMRAELTKYDGQNGIDNTLGYFFFSEQNGALALFELLCEYPQILCNEVIDPVALHNNLWQNHPDYVAMYNRNEQEGLHDCLAQLLRCIGEDVEPVIRPEHLITLTVGTGIDYLNL